MAEMYGLFLESDKCADGVDLIAMHGRPCFVSRTDRRVSNRLEMKNLENPVVVEFINAREDTDLLKFFSKFGRLDEHIYNREAEWDQPSHDRDNVIVAQKHLREWLVRATGENRADTLRAINESLGRSMAIDLTPTFELEAETGAPRMLLRCSHLW